MELTLEDLGFSETSYEQPVASQQRQRPQQQHRGGNNSNRGRQQRDQTVVSGDRDSRSVYVSNLDRNINRDQLNQLFGCCGAIRCITIPRSPETQQTLGHAYIEFSNPTEAEAAVKLHRQVQVKGRPVSVNPKRTNIRGYDVFNGHMGMGRRGRRGGMLAGGMAMSFGRQGAVFPLWGPPPYYHQ